MKVLVLGGTRFIGPAVVRRLVGAGHEVIVVHRGLTETELPDGVRHLHTGPAQVAPMVSFPAEAVALRPDVVLHMILYGGQDAAAAVEAFAGVTSRLVMISSADVYRAFDIANRRVSGAVELVPLTETSALRDRLFPYRGTDSGDPALEDYDKILAEQAACADERLPTTVLRLPMVYGPGDRRHRLRPWVRRMAAARPTIVLDAEVARWRGCYGFVENVASAVAAAVCDERATGRLYNVADLETPTTLELVQRLGEAAGWPGRVIVAPPGTVIAADLAADADLQQDLVLDGSRLRAELDWTQPVGLREALAATFAWEAESAVEGEAAIDTAAEDAAAAAGAG